MKNQAPIGLFDSGIGGTSIWKEIHTALPHEDTVYLADSKHAPYGNKSQQQILDLSVKNTELLLSKGCKLIVVACNTATTNAIAHLRAHYPVPFIGIEPAIKPAGLQTATRSIGILATRGTLNSQLFHNTSSRLEDDIQITEVIGEGLVPLIEAGRLDDPEMHSLLEHYMQPMMEANIDYLVLGCSHYPYLIPQLKKILPEHITIIDSGEAVARQTAAVLTQHGLLRVETREPTLEFYTNADITSLQQVLTPFANQIQVTSLDF